jgi:hypothetical protein
MRYEEVGVNTLQSSILGWVLATGTTLCPAQDTTNLPERLTVTPHLRAFLEPVAGTLAAGPSSESMPTAASSSSSEPAAAFSSYFERVPAPAHPRTIDRNYLLLNGLHLGMAMFDVGMTHLCISDGQCREGNPLMTSSLSGQLSISLALTAYGSAISYRLKKHGSRLWWISPVSGTAAHIAGVATGFAHR